MNRRPWLSTALRFVAILFAAGAGPHLWSATPAEEFFERKIRPVLIEHCQECHSATTKVRGGLALDSRADLLTGGETGPAVVPGKPDESLLIRAVQHRNPDLAMPAKQPRLPDAVLADLVTWVREGAAWPGNTAPSAPRESFDLAARKERLPWIWETPRRQPVPVLAAGASPAGDIDRFLGAKLEEMGITPAPPTDDRTWLRRVHFVITGLPPAPEAVRAFAADPSPSKRERLVDGLLASPHFGERWARHWMDLVRYAESRGHESDFPIPNAWQYRDYLVRALNADLPYDRFLSEHLAGDVLPPRVDPVTGINESVLATGWAFLGEEVHSPVDIRQDECERVDNKVDVLSKTFLGLTVACARCHDHKFDAITQRDYYALSGFILGSSYRQVRFETEPAQARLAADLAAVRDRHRPRITAAFSTALEAGLTNVASRLLAAVRVTRDGKPPEAAPAASVPAAGSEAVALSAWAAELRAAATNAGHVLHGFATLARECGEPGVSTNTLRARTAAGGPRPSETTLPADTRILADFTAPDRSPWKTDGPVFGTRALAAGDVVLGSSPTNPIARVMPYGAARRDAFWNRLGLEPGNESEAGSFNATGQAGRMLRTSTFELGTGRLHYLLRGRARVYAAVDSHIMLAGPLHGSLVTTVDGGPEASWVTHDLGAYAGHRTHLEFAPEGDGDLEILMVVETPEKPAFRPVTPWWPSAQVGSLEELAANLQADLLEAARRLGTDDVGVSRRLAPLAAWLVDHRAWVLPPGPPAEAVAAAVGGFLREQETLARTMRWTSRTAVAWFDGTGVDERILLRGKPSRPGDPAPRRLPTAFGTPPIPDSDSSGRAALARQLADPANPLVARVQVNRVWQHVFGRGIVGTPDNFGYLGERPTHPELLDHLAWQFVHEDRWSLKTLIRRLVLTETFARSSRAATGRAAEVDPADLLWHRMPVRRLEAEAVRDAVLATSGRLDPRLGGPPVPVHLTEFIIGRGRPERSGPLDGDGRRSLYTAAPRNFLPTMMVAFDLPTPFSTVGRRNTTNVPGQPLTLMNDPFMHEQARYWAARVIRTLPGANDDTRVRWMFETAYARPPAAPEVEACLATLAELRGLPAEAGEIEIWGDLAHALLNANEFIYLN